MNLWYRIRKLQRARAQDGSTRPIESGVTEEDQKFKIVRLKSKISTFQTRVLKNKLIELNFIFRNEN